MSQKEVRRLAVLSRVLDEELLQSQAAQPLGLSVRPVKRLCRRLREQGPAGSISRRRGRPSNRRIDDAQRVRFAALVRTHDGGVGPLLAHEYRQRDHRPGFGVKALRPVHLADR